MPFGTRAPALDTVTSRAGLGTEAGSIADTFVYLRQGEDARVGIGTAHFADGFSFQYAQGRQAVVQNDLLLPSFRIDALEVHETKFGERGIQLRLFLGDDGEVFLTENHHEFDWDGIKEGNEVIPFLPVWGRPVREDSPRRLAEAHRIVVDALRNVWGNEAVDVALLEFNNEPRYDRGPRPSTDHGRVEEVVACLEDAVEMLVVRKDEFEVSGQWTSSLSDERTELDSGHLDL